ncbi:acyl-CoA dehydrogenase family protein [Nocardia sp. R6R-6]|uniref:acyl-CoA dehydrogenase family protein n=1 Tax=Nocardia sp. R6R-6 TaxID=3459303 RepID=UPI00403D5843
MHKVTEQIEDIAAQLAEQAVPSDELGRVTDDAVTLLRSSGTVRLLQPLEYGGYEATLEEFLETVMLTASIAPPVGWIAGVIGVHPWEFAQTDPRLQAELWGADPDTWTASPIAPMGKATTVDGGFRLSGRWSFSSGTDHCQWAILGGVVTDRSGEGGAPLICHFVLPRTDYEIIEDTWDVVGLKGTGSKDIVVQDAFIPDYRVVETAKLFEGGYADENRPENPLYALPFGVVFSYALGAATIGITEGALAAFVNYTSGRVSMDGSRVNRNPHQLAMLGACTADIRASRAVLLDQARRVLDITNSGRKVTAEERLECRLDQVRATRRAVDAVDALFVHAGGGSLRSDQPFQRYWRDAHAAMNHFCNISEPVYEGYSANRFGVPVGAVFY